MLTSSPQSSEPSLGDSAPPRVIFLRQAVPRLPWEVALSQQQRVSSPVLAIFRPLWQIACSHQQRGRSSRQAVPRQAVPRQAVPSLPQRIALSHRQKVHSPRQAFPRLPWQIALFSWQRVVSPRFPKLPRQTTLSHLQRVNSPQAVRCSARLRARQAGTFPREVSKVSQGDSTVPQRVLPQDNASQEAMSSPCRHSTPQGSSP